MVVAIRRDLGFLCAAKVDMMIKGITTLNSSILELEKPEV